MAIPKLTDAAGGNTVTFTRGESFPLNDYPYLANQDVEYTRDKYAIVRENGSPQRYFNIVVNNETATVSGSVKDFFRTTIEYMKNTFRYYPDKDVASYRTVRLTKPSIQNDLISSPSDDKRYNIEIQCKEE